MRQDAREDMDRPVIEGVIKGAHARHLVRQIVEAAVMRIQGSGLEIWLLEL